MRRGLVVVLGLMQAGCYAWATPPLEARVGVGPAWDSRAHAVRAAPSYQATVPISGWGRAPHVNPTWDAQAGYFVQPLSEAHAVHGPSLELGLLLPDEQTDPKPGTQSVSRGCLPLVINQGVTFRRYGVHGQVRGLFGEGAGVEVAGRFSLEWARHVSGGNDTSAGSLLHHGAWWDGYQATGVFLEANAGFQGTRPRWGITAGVSFRVPASLGFGLPDTEKLRQLDWVKKVNARNEAKR